MKKEEQIVLGAGTYSRVVVDKKEPNTVIKITDGTDYDNIIREVACLSRLQHPNIISPEMIWFTAEGSCNIKMERYPDNMHTYVIREGLPTTPVMLKMMIELFTALYYIHTRGIIHGDIKPRNILIKKGSIAICDFNISCLVSDDPISSVLQTCNYRAPEVDMKKERCMIDTRIDVFSAGCIMYELITGEPFLKLSGTEEDEDSTIALCKSMEIVHKRNHAERCYHLNKLRLVEVKEKIIKSNTKTRWTIPHGYKLDEYIAIIALCIMPNRIMRARADQILYMLLKLFRSVSEGADEEIEKMMYGVSMSHSHRKPIRLHSIKKLEIANYVDVDIIRMFNLSTINYANRLLLRYRRVAPKDWRGEKSIYVSLYIAMSICGEPHRDIEGALEEKFSRRQLYNAAVAMVLALDFRLLD